MSEQQSLWCVGVSVPAAAVDLVEDMLGDDALAVSRFEDGGPDIWRVEALFPHAPLSDHIEARLALASAASGCTLGTPTVIPVAQRDWVRESQENLPPIRAGRFYIHGSHDPATTCANLIDLLVDAGPAFGTGRHGSTYGCLQAIEILRWKPIRHALDLGCGTGLLALAMTKIWPAAQIAASDIDPDAVRTTRENARVNRVAGRVRPVVSDGLARRRTERTGGYQLIVANILARPLVGMAPDIKKHLTPGGTVVLSGLLVEQEALVLSAFRMQSLYLDRRITVDGWRTLILR